jgi:hypothetical protein
MKRKKYFYSTILNLFLFQIVGNQLLATTYYIDFQNGKDNNNGKSIAAAFKHCPGDPNAETIAKSTLLKAGDTVTFKGDTHYRGHVVVNQSGEKRKPIVFISGHTHIPGWGSTNAVIDAENVSLSSKRNGAISLNDNSYITIKGLKIVNVPATGNDSYYGCIGWKGERGGNIIIENCITVGLNGNGIMLHGCWHDKNDPPSNFYIKSCDIGFSGCHGLHLRGGLSNVTIINSTIHNNGKQEPGNGIFSGSGSTGFLRNLTIRGCTIFDNPTKGPMNISGHDFVIENNFLYSTVELAIGLTIGTEFYVPSMSSRNIMIKNNIIDLQTKYEGAIRVRIPLLSQYSKLYSIKNIKIYNNTIIQRGDYYALYFNARTSCQSKAIDSVEIINNIIMSAEGCKICIYTDHNTKIPHFIVHHNYYHSASNYSPFVFDTKPVSYSAWTLTYKGDYIQTDFKNPFPGINTHSTTASAYYPPSDAPFKDKGIHLKDISFDYFGQPRDSLCDIGAVECLTDSLHSPE